MPRTRSIGAARAARPRAPGGDLQRAVHAADRARADRPRDRRQRLVLPRPRRGVPLAPAQPAGAGREAVGDRAPLAARVPRRERLLVVRDGRDDRLHRHAAADLPRGRCEVARLLHGSAGAARPPHGRAGRVPALHLLGADGRPHVVALDRVGGAEAAARGVARPADGLPPASRLRPPALRARRAASPPRRRASWTACSATWPTSRASAATRSSSCPSTGSPTRGGRSTSTARCARAGLLDVYTQAGMEYLDPWTSRAFAVADHQIAHVYVRDPGDVGAAREALAGLAGSTELLDGDEQGATRGLGHERAGELVARRRAGRLVHVLLLARRRARARLRAPGRDPPQARLRPGRAVHGPGRPARQGARGRRAGPQEDSACAT